MAPNIEILPSVGAMLYSMTITPDLPDAEFAALRRAYSDHGALPWHFALNDYHGQRRIMHRVTVSGVCLG